MEFLLEQAFRRAFIPKCCGGASVLFAFYGVKVERGARSWEALAAVTAANNSSVAVQAGSADGEKDNSHLSTTTLQIDYARQQANKLHQHAGTCASLALTSAAITWQATKDWWYYRKLRRLNDMETWLLRRRLFFIRSPVLFTALLSLGSVDYYLGGVRIFYWPEVL